MRLHAPSPFHACQVLAGPMSGGDGEPKARSPKWLISCSADAKATTLLQTPAVAARRQLQHSPLRSAATSFLPPAPALAEHPVVYPFKEDGIGEKQRRGLIRASCILPSLQLFRCCLTLSATIEYPSSDCHSFRLWEMSWVGSVECGMDGSAAWTD